MGQLSKEPLSLGKVGYLNVLPIFYPLEAGIVPHPFAIVHGTPAYLCGLMARGELDVGVVSSIEYARHPDRYFILPDLSISCCGAVKSVMLFSSVPLERLAGQSILVTTQSHTSVALLKVLFSQYLGIDVAYRSGSCTEALAKDPSPVAFLAIGDEALRLRRQEAYPYRLDLGEAWHTWTGLPFVFAAWLIQRQTIERWSANLGPAIRALTRAKEWGLAHLERVCSEGAKQGVLSHNELEEYYAGFSFGLSETEQQGLELFFRYLFAMGEIDRLPCLEVFSPVAYVA